MLRLRTLIFAVSTAVLAAGCGSAGSTPAAGTAASTKPVAERTAAQPAPTAKAKQRTIKVPLAQVTKVGVQAKDLPAGYKGGVIPGGDAVAGQVTLDMCGTHFASEDLRLARHQVGFTKSSSSVSSEVVVYHAGGAAQALAEVRQSAAHCPSGLIQSTVAGVPPTTQKVVVHKNAKGLPRDAISVSMSMTVPSTGQHEQMEAVYVVRGPVLAGVYVQGGGAAAVTLERKLAVLVAARMAKAFPAA